jgi:cyclophilin family peptidyl-prolyl cis-trans isomerase
MMYPRLLAVLFVLAASGLAAAKNPVVVMETSYGTIKVELFEDKAPITTKNFLAYVDDKHYDGTIFHRVLESRVVQGGGYTPGMTEKKTKDPIKNESNNGLKNVRGTIAMARTQVLDSATAQFYFNVIDNAAFDEGKYAVFGRVLDGIEIVDKIGKVTTVFAKGYENVPVEDIVIKSVRREKP